MSPEAPKWDDEQDVQSQGSEVDDGFMHQFGNPAIEPTPADHAPDALKPGQLGYSKKNEEEAGQTVIGNTEDEGVQEAQEREEL